jgi:GntR family transcriptional regulator, rspAB operon transcriptional repressor
MSTPSSHKLKRSADVAEQVFQRLIESILQGELRSGQTLREAAVARAWNVSRTPLREAVRRASELGLLLLRPNQAPLVRSFSVKDVHGLYALREVLELYALRVAWPALLGDECEKMLALARKTPPPRPGWKAHCLDFDLKLHQWWTKHCKNPWLKNDLDRHYQFLRIFQRWMGRNPSALAQAYHEHLAILDAIEKRDRKAALAAVRNHIRQSKRLVEDAVQRENTDTG